jgi:wyosine [tRNA(Phe)-imidazoG37] synthetase (radical SAM superfamily)
MGVLALETEIVYGPILSRRLGLSLGVNLLPTRYKPCSFDCIYCHYGPTHVKSLKPEPRSLPRSQNILRAVEIALREHSVDYVTFSGNGEPTLHPAFAGIAEAVARLRDKIAPQTKLALFSNSSTAHRKDVRQALAFFDLPMMKLDAGDPDTLAAINQPAQEVSWDAIIAGLQQVDNLVIQSVLIDGRITNIKGSAFEAWVDTLANLDPSCVQIYSTEYPVPQNGVERVLPYELKRIAREVSQRTGLRVEPLHL